MVTIPQGTSPKKIAVKLIKSYGKTKALQMATSYNIPVGVMNLVLSTPMGQGAVKDFKKMSSDLKKATFGRLTSSKKEAKKQSAWAQSLTALEALEIEQKKLEKPIGEAAGLKPSEYLTQLLEDATGGQLSQDFIDKYVTKKGILGKKSKFQKWKANEQANELNMLRQNILREEYGDYPIADKNKRNSVIKQLNSMIERTGTGQQLASNFDWKKSFKDKGKNGIKFGQGVQVASSDPTTNLGIDWSKQFDGTTKSIPKPKVTQPTMRDVAGPVVKQPIYKDTAQGQGQREEQMQRQQQQQQEREKYKDTATTGAKAGYTYGLQSGGRIKRKIKKVKSKYAKGGGVRTSKYKL
jgi:hypothetical protein